MPAVSSTCLALQNSYGLDVNLLLFACWHARTRGVFDPKLIRDAMSFSSMWANNVVKPLRGARTWMKANEHTLWERARPRSTSAFNLLRKKIKSVELECEKFQEDMLETLVQTPAQELAITVRISAAAQNLRSIVEASAVPLSDAVAESLYPLILNALDLAENAEILQTIHNELTCQAG